MESSESMTALTSALERMEARLEAAASLFERTVATLDERDGEVRKMVATIETRQESGTAREAELAAKLAAAEQQIAELRARMETGPETGLEMSLDTRLEAKPSPRRTVPAATAQFLSKQGIALESIEAGALDAALSGLSLEQRIAVKAQLLRAGVVG